MQMQPFLPYAKHHIHQDDIDAVTKVLKGEKLTQGETIELFEKEFAKKVGCKYAVAVCNGTAALHLAVETYLQTFKFNLRNNLALPKIVYVPTLSFIATANCVKYAGLKPVFRDIALCDNTLLMDQRTEPNNPNIIVNFAGNMAKLYPNKTYIVDAAHSLGAQHDFVNSEMTCFSLHPAKTITCGEGGVVATNHRGYYEILKKLREHGIVREPPFKHEYTDISYVIDTLGYNYRMTDIQAALALSQLSRLENYVLDRKNTLRRYTELIKDLNQESQEVLAQYMKPIERTENNSYNLNVVRLSLFREQRDKVFKKMRVEHNIGVTLHYPLIHKTELYKSELQLVGAEITEGQIMTLPLFYGMRDEEIFRVVKSLSFSILDVLKEYGGSPIIEKSTTSNETVDANYREVYNYNKTVDPVTNVTTYK